MANPKAKRPVRRITTYDSDDSDDVSALSMAGASVLAARAYAILSQPQQNLTAGHATIPEDHDAEHDVGEAVEQQRASLDGGSTSRGKKSSPDRRPPLSPDKLHASVVDSLFPDHESEHHAVTFEEWQKGKKKKEKKKHKQKKHSKRDRSNEYIDVIQLPINEIYLPTDDNSYAKDSFKDSFAPTHPPASRKEIRCNQSVASTAESTGSRYQRRDSLHSIHMGMSGSGVLPGATVVNTFRSLIPDLPDIPQLASHKSSSRPHHSNPEHLRPPLHKQSSFQSHSTHDSNAHKSHHSGNESLAHLSCHSVHSAAYSYASFSSRVSVEDVQKVKIELERAKEEEMKVLQLYSKIEEEISSLVGRISALEEQRSNVESELESASAERQGLQSFLNKILDDNTRLNAKLQSMEDEEDEKRMDDVLDGMQAKMRALRLKGNMKGKGQK